MGTTKSPGAALKWLQPRPAHMAAQGSGLL